MITYNMRLLDEKKHSVRYRSSPMSDKQRVVFYIPKRDLPEPFPQEITVKITDRSTGG